MLVLEASAFIGVWVRIPSSLPMPWWTNWQSRFLEVEEFEGSNPSRGTTWEQVSKEATGLHQTVNLDLFGGIRFDSFRSHHNGRLAKWQTRVLQVHVPSGFESPVGYHRPTRSGHVPFIRASVGCDSLLGRYRLVTKLAHVAVSKTAFCGFDSRRADHLLMAEQADAAGLNPVFAFGRAGSNPARETNGCVA